MDGALFRQKQGSALTVARWWALAAVLTLAVAGCYSRPMAPSATAQATTVSSPVLPSPGSSASDQHTPTLSALQSGVLATPSGVPTGTPTTMGEPTAPPLPTPSPSPIAIATRARYSVAIDPGHGGIDLGARHFGRDGNMDFHESTVTLQIALRLEEQLRSRGYRVVLTRDGDYLPSGFKQDLNGDGKVTYRDDLLWRVRSLNESGVDLFLSLHQNAWAHNDEELVRSTGGCTTYYCPDREFGASNLELARLVQKSILDAVRSLGYDVFDRGVQPDDTLAVPGESGDHLILLGPQDDVIKWASAMPGALNEPFFITCDAEAVLMRKPEVQQLLAQAYADAIDAYWSRTGGRSGLEGGAP